MMLVIQMQNHEKWPLLEKWCDEEYAVPRLLLDPNKFIPMIRLTPLTMAQVHPFVQSSPHQHPSPPPQHS